MFFFLFARVVFGSLTDILRGQSTQTHLSEGSETNFVWKTTWPFQGRFNVSLLLTTVRNRRANAKGLSKLDLLHGSLIFFPVCLKKSEGNLCLLSFHHHCLASEKNPSSKRD